jgi:heat shock protein HslJ
MLLIALTLSALGCMVSQQPLGGRPTPIATRMTGLRMGPLTMVDGCLRIGEGKARHVVVWPPDFEVSREGDLMWVFYDDHEVELRLGQVVTLSGGEVESIDAFDERTRQQVPTGCAGPYWLVGSVDLAGETDSPEASDGLVGTEWLLLSLNGERIMKGTEITLGFGEEHLGGSMTCGAYGGDPGDGGYSATRDGMLTVHRPLATSAETCSEPEDIMIQEAAYVEALQRAAAYQIAFDSLQIADASGEVTLVFTSRE